MEAWFVAAVVSLGATITGPAVLTVEYEPVPRGFALGLLLFAIGLAAHERFLAAGFASASAFLFRAPTAAPFLIVAAIPALRRRIRWTLFLPVAAAALALMMLARAQPSGLESLSAFRRLDAFDEWIQRTRAAYSYVSTWRAAWFWDIACQTLIATLAFWRMRDSMPAALGTLLRGLTIAGIASVPFSWALLEWQKWALIPQWQPARSVLFLTLAAALLSAVAGMRACRARRFIEAAAWFTVAFVIPMKHAGFGRTLPLAIGLALFAMAAACLAPHLRGAALALAGIVPFLAIPASGLVKNYPRVSTPELIELSQWARPNTSPDRVFLFPDAHTGLDPGVFRARAQRALYVDWKSGRQVNYFPEFAREWWKRWLDTGRGAWNITAVDLPQFAAMGIDYVVLRSTHAIPGETPEFSNLRYVVYATSSRDSLRCDWRNSSLLWLHCAPSRSRPPSATGPCD